MFPRQAPERHTGQQNVESERRGQTGKMARIEHSLSLSPDHVEKVGKL